MEECKAYVMESSCNYHERVKVLLGSQLTSFLFSWNRFCERRERCENDRLCKNVRPMYSNQAGVNEFLYLP